MMRKILTMSALVGLMMVTKIVPTFGAEIPTAQSWLDKNPHLKQYLFTESDTQLRLGFGVSPLHLMKNKAGIALSIFQLHRMTAQWDWEIFNGTFARSISGDSFSKANSFHFRTFPKYRLTDTISIGVLAGYEFISFPDIKSRIFKDNHFTIEGPLSSRGFIYGVGASQLFKLADQHLMRVSELVFKQTYDVRNSGDQGWQYFYADAALNRDPSPIEPGIVMEIEISFLY